MAFPHVLSDIRWYSSHESTVVPYASMQCSRALLVIGEPNPSHDVLLQYEIAIKVPGAMIETIKDICVHPEASAEIVSEEGIRAK